MAQVRLENVWKVYDGGVEAVKGLSLTIADGEFVVLVGASGCGKSTTLRMIAGLEEVSERAKPNATGGKPLRERGRVIIGERDVTDVHPKDRDIAMVFQNYALYPHMTVFNNMAFALKLRRVPKAEIERRVLEAARMLGIEPLLGRKPRQLSGGQRQRVAVGRAIVREPKCFLFDEPLSNLDAKLRVVTRGELKALHQRLRTTTVYVTHDQEEAMTLGDRVCVMAQGVIQQSASPFEVYQHPANRFVAGFIGTPPMNFLEGKLEQRDGRPVFVHPFGEGQTLTIAPAPRHRAMLQPHAGKPVVMGIRPSAMREAEVGEMHLRATAEQRLLRARVHVIEPLGDQMDVHMTLGPLKMTARVPAHSSLAPGRESHFAVDVEHAHYFEPGDFGRNLVAPTGAASPN